MIFENQFGRAEKLLHQFSFRTGFSQVMLADLETRIFAHELRDVPVDRPVFLSGLPRSGTTILLEILSASGRFATHTYRDMPFILSPMLWNRFSRRFAVDDEPRERAHGDGIRVSGSSPEAFEEIIWKQFWPRHYKSDRIEPWTASEQKPEFDEFFESHMAKIVCLRMAEDGVPPRYLSKNNASIARLAGPIGPLRLGMVLVPFREPLQHAASLLRQHRRFTELQSVDSFARQYMDGIGHYDFGLGFRPIDFDGWLSRAGEPEELNFWLRYWRAAYAWILGNMSADVRLVSYRRLTEAPEESLRFLARTVGIAETDILCSVDRLRRPRQHSAEVADVNAEDHRDAQRVYRELESISSRQD